MATERETQNSVATYEQEVRHRIEAMSYLPTTVAVAMRFIDLGKDPQAGTQDYTKVISSDSSLSTKLLSLSNSSWFGVRQQVTKVQVAVNLLGLSTVRTLAISYCATGVHSGLRLTPDELRMFWAASLSKAVAARQLTKRAHPEWAEEAFAAGLFEDFAIPFMYATAKKEMLALLHDRSGSRQDQLRQERELFRLDHSELGRSIAQKIGLPQMFVDAVTFHHNHQSLTDLLDEPAMADAIYVASLFPHLLDGWRRDDVQALRAFLTERYGLPLDVFLAEVQEEFDELYAYFENGAQSDTSLTRLMEDATREMADTTTRLVGTLHGLMHENAVVSREVQLALSKTKEVEEAAAHDPLTGVLNRRGFIGQASEVLARAYLTESPVAVAFLDLDDFKRVNDSHGHRRGDEALHAVAQVVLQYIRHGDVFGRVGGDEFALLLGNCTQQGAVQAVHRIVEAVGRNPVGEGDKALDLTVSVGMVWAKAPSSVDALDALLGEADGLMYQAKEAGGGRLEWQPYTAAEEGEPAGQAKSATQANAGQATDQPAPADR